MSETGIISLLALLRRESRTLLIATGIGLLLAVIVVIFKPRTWTTTVSFMPKSENQSSAGLASLAGQFGIALGGLTDEQPPQLYADLLLTRGVLAPIAADSFIVDSTSTTRVPLSDYLDVKGDSPGLRLENTMRELRRDVISSTVAARTTGMVTVNVRTRSPQLSYAIAERLLERLNHFNLVTRQSQARAEREFTEARLADAKDSLRASEDRLQRFLQSNRDVDRSPALRFESERLEREVRLQEQIVSTLAQQYEENRIREVRDTPVITVFEAPVVAVRADPGLRAVILVLGVAAGFFAGVLVVLARDAWRREVNDWRQAQAA